MQRAFLILLGTCSVGLGGASDSRALHHVLNPEINDAGLLLPQSGSHSDPLESHLFTGSAKVVDGSGATKLLQSRGFANKEFAAKMPVNASFLIGSNSKLFVTVALYQLQERGLVNVSSPVARYLDAADFRRFGHVNVSKWCPQLYGSSSDECMQPTIEDLLAMRSGLIDVVNCEYEAGSPFLEYCWKRPPGLSGLQLLDGLYSGDMAKLIGNFIMNPFAAAPGTKYQYVNANFILASYLVEKLSNMGLGEYLQKHVLGPLNLTHTHLDNVGRGFSIENWRVPDSYTDFLALDGKESPRALGSGRQMLEFAPGAVSGCGGMASTVDDMVAWYQGLFRDSNPVLSRDSIRSIVRPRILVAPQTYFAQGVLVQLYNETSGWPEVILYEGGTFGHHTAMRLHVPSGIAVAAFSSTVHTVIKDAEAFDRIALSKSGALADLLAPIVSGTDDGGAGSLSDVLLKSAIHGGGRPLTISV